MKIGFVTDTNILKKNIGELNKEEKFLNNIDFFIEYIESLEKTSSDKQLIYFMPSVVIEELYYQKLSAFNIRYDALKDTYDEIAYGLNGEFPKCDIEKVLLEEKEKYKSNERITMLDLQYNESIFKEIMEDALRKNPPFDKSNEGYKTDSGYKDALIWKTIIYSKEINDCDKVYFFSGDKIFVDNEEYLIEEFSKQHQNVELKIVFYKPDIEQRQNCLKCIIQDNDLIETEIIKLYDTDLILNSIKEIKYNYREDVYYNNQEQSNKLEDVLFNEFERNDFNIENVIEEDEKYQVLIQYRTEKYNISNDAIIDSINRKILRGKIKLIFKKNKRNFELENYEIIYSKFAIGLEETLSNISDIIKTSMLNSNYESYMVNLTKSLAPIAEKMADMKLKLIDSERINTIINNSPFWMEQFNTLNNDLSNYKTLIDGLEKNKQEIQEDKKIKPEEKRKIPKEKKEDEN